MDILKKDHQEQEKISGFGYRSWPASGKFFLKFLNITKEGTLGLLFQVKTRAIVRGSNRQAGEDFAPSEPPLKNSGLIHRKPYLHVLLLHRLSALVSSL